jgi:hypothetical protein
MNYSSKYRGNTLAESYPGVPGLYDRQPCAGNESHKQDATPSHDILLLTEFDNLRVHIIMRFHITLMILPVPERLSS